MRVLQGGCQFALIKIKLIFAIGLQVLIVTCKCKIELQLIS